MGDAANDSNTGRVETAVVDVEEAVPSLTRTTAQRAGSIMLGQLAGLVLQVWIIAFLGWQGPEALYVRSIYAPIGFLTLAITVGVGVTMQIAAGIAARNGDQAGALRNAPTFLLVGGGLLVLIAVVFAVASNPILSALGVARIDRPLTTTFIITVSLANALGLAPGLAGAAIRGVGNALSSSLFGIGSTIIAIAAMVLLYATTDLGILAVPLGELIATAVIGIIIFLALSRHGIELPLPRLVPDAIRQLRVMALPIATTFLLLSIVNFGYLYVLRNAGSDEIAGFGLANTLTQFLTMPATAIGSGAAISATLLPASNRSKPNRAGLSALLRVVAPVYLVVGTLAFLFRGQLAEAFTSSPSVAAAAADYLTWYAPTLVLFGGTLAMLTFLEQIGQARNALILNVIYFTAILVALLFLQQPVQIVGLAQVLAIGNLVGFWTLLASTQYLVRRPVKE